MNPRPDMVRRALPGLVLSLSLPLLGGCGSEATDSLGTTTTTPTTTASTTGGGGAGGGEPVAGASGGPLCGPAPGLPPSGEPTAWRSPLVPADWHPGFADAQGRFVHDFSYAGYHLGTERWPDAVEPVVDVTAAPYGADPTGVEDSTAAIQQALDDVGVQGGGTVLMPAGTYRVLPPDPTTSHKVLRVRYSHVVLRGEGRDRTFLFNDATVMSSGDVILVRPEEDASSDWFDAVGAAVPLTVDAANQADSVTVDDASGFAVGDRIVVKGNATAEWIAEHHMTGLWPTGSGQIGPTFLRRVRSVSGSELGLDVPLRYPVLTRDSGRVFHPPEQLEEIGLVDFSIGMREHPGTTGWADDDYLHAGTPASEVNNAAAIRMVHVENAWIERVASYRPPGNTQAVHLLSLGVFIDQSRAVTVRDVLMQQPQYEGGGGNGYLFVLQGNELLVGGCAAVSARHAYTMSLGTTSGNVVRHSSSTDSRLASDFHRFLATSNLLEGLVLDADWIDATYRPDGTVMHGYTTTQSTFWNIFGRRYHSTGSFVVDSRQFDWGLAIGTRGPAPNIKTTPTLDTKETAPEDWHEGDGAGGTLEPASLYDEQLYRRTHDGAAPPREVPLAVLAPTEDGYVRDGSYAADVHGDAERLEVKDASADWARRSFLKFDLGEVGFPVARAILAVHGRITDQGGGQSVTTAYGVSDDSWQEASLTWNAQPALGPYLARRLVTDEAGWWPFDVTPFVRAQQRADGVVSFALAQSLGGAGLLASFGSSESADYAPRLELVPVEHASLEIVEVTGDEAAPDTSIAAVIDGDYATRWSNETYGASLTFDLGTVQPVTGLGVATHQGADRIQFFEVRASVDGVSWTAVMGGQTDAYSDELQRFFFEPLEARYLKLVGYGNSKNAWNSVTEVELYGC
jgi:hypothetical protein